MKYDLEWHEMTDREKKLWKELTRERRVLVIAESDLNIPNHKFRLKIYGGNPDSDMNLDLQRQLAEKYPVDKQIGDHARRDKQLLAMDSPVKILNFGGSYQLYANSLEDIQPALDIIYNHPVSKIYYVDGEPIEKGRNALKLDIERAIKEHEVKYPPKTQLG